MVFENFMISIIDFMVANICLLAPLMVASELNLQRSILQLRPWNFQIHYSYLLIHGFLKTVEVINSTVLILSRTNILLGNDYVRPLYFYEKLIEISILTHMPIIFNILCKNPPKQNKSFVRKIVEVSWARHTCRFKSWVRALVGSNQRL
jgi:hypothetical protein